MLYHNIVSGKCKTYMLFTGNAAEAFFSGKNLSSTTKGRRICEQLNHPWADTRGKPSQASASKEERNFFLIKK